MNNYELHLDEEIRILEKGLGDGDKLIVSRHIPAIKEVLRSFSSGAESGGSASFTAGAITDVLKKTMLFQPLSDITGEDSEWGQRYGDAGFQNKRLSSIFKKSKKAQAYYLDAIVFQGDKTGAFTSSAVKLNDETTISSRQYIKTLPFKPKTFYIDVIETEWADENETEKKEGGGWWTSVVKDEIQLKDVFEYYDRFDTTENA